MKHCSRCSQDKPKEDFYINKNLKSGLSCWCKACARIKNLEYTKKRNSKNPCAARERMAQYRKDPKIADKMREKYRVKYHEDPEKFRAKTTKWRAENPEKNRMYRSQWWDSNPGARNASRMKRYASKLQATPIWVNEFFIKEIYHLAKLRTKTFGIEFEVDHIVPLQSEIVCGLHVENNMQLLISKQNKLKGNRSWPDMP